MNNDIVMNNTEASFAVKVIKGEEMRRFNFKGQSFQELKKIVAEIFSITDDFSLQYEDDEKDMVTLSSDSELKEAIQLHKYVLRFFLVAKPAATAAGENNTPLPFPYPPYHYHQHPHHRRHHHHEHAHGGEVMAADGEVPHPPPFGRHGPHGRPYGPYGPHRHHGHGPNGHHKRRFEKEEKEAMKCERKKWKKQRKCESSSSSSSSSSDDDTKIQRKEMKELMKATKQSIKANWAPVKETNPAQWRENRKLMVAEMKMAKRLIRAQAYAPASPVVVATEPAAAVTPGVEMQA